MSKSNSGLGDAIRAARAAADTEPQNQNTSLPESGKTGISDAGEDAEQLGPPAPEWVNLTVRVDKRQRVHWVIEAKRRNTSLTAAVIEAMNERFGPAPSE